MPVALALVGCASTAPSSAQTTSVPYDKTWNIAKFWSGEYPTGFSVTRRGTIVLARSGMDKSLPRTIKCELPYLAVIHPWNQSRVKKSNIEFLSATKIERLTAKQDFDFHDIAIKKGDILEYVQPFSEGMFQVRVAGKLYDADETLFEQLEDVEKGQLIQDEWVALNCQRGGRAYIYLADIDVRPYENVKSTVPGISDMGPEAMGYGKTRDITEKEARELEKKAK